MQQRAGRILAVAAVVGALRAEQVTEQMPAAAGGMAVKLWRSMEILLLGFPVTPQEFTGRYHDFN
jgi:hypothetical protein